MVLTDEFLAFQQQNNNIFLLKIDSMKLVHQLRSMESSFMIRSGLEIIQRRNELLLFFAQKDSNYNMLDVVHFVY